MPGDFKSVFCCCCCCCCCGNDSLCNKETSRSCWVFFWKRQSLLCKTIRTRPNTKRLAKILGAADIALNDRRRRRRLLLLLLLLSMETVVISTHNTHKIVLFCSPSLLLQNCTVSRIFPPSNAQEEEEKNTSFVFLHIIPSQKREKEKNTCMGWLVSSRVHGSGAAALVGMSSLVQQLVVVLFMATTTTSCVGAFSLSSSNRWKHQALFVSAQAPQDNNNNQISNDNDDSLALANALKTMQTNHNNDNNQNDNKWYSTMKRLPFECTGCGKCCQTTGSVWMSPMEIRRAADLIQLSVTDFCNQYASHTLEPNNHDENDLRWIRLKDQTDDNGSGACVFLDPTTQQCTIYEARPNQCSTYPFWPKIMKSRKSWNEEVRLPDNPGSLSSSSSSMEESTTLVPHWTAKNGGCEGMRWIPDPSSSSSLEEKEKDDDDNGGGGGGVELLDALFQLNEYERDERRFPTGTVQQHKK